MEPLEFLCLLGGSDEELLSARHWLSLDEGRRLVMVDERENPFVWESGIRKRVSQHVLESPLQIPFLARKIAWEAVFLPIQILGGKEGRLSLFAEELRFSCLAVNAGLSDAADWGVCAARNSFLQRDARMRDGRALPKRFAHTPAIIIGAGASLQENQDFLVSLQDQALLFAGGYALNLLPFEPHLAGSIDKAAPYEQFKRFSYWQTPFCIQPRMNSENFSLLHGEILRFPDTHFSSLQSGDLFDGGWTVSTFLTAIAAKMGCNPIFFVGMDLCCSKEAKYGDGSGVPCANLQEARTKEGQDVLTQGDWLLARHWLEDFARRHPEISFFYTGNKGLGFAEPIQNKELSAFAWPERRNLRKEMHEMIQGLPFFLSRDIHLWRGSLEQCAQRLEAFCLPEGEEAYEALLAPLWGLWEPVIARALEEDSHPDKIAINRILFFQQVVQEHLHVIGSMELR